MSERRVNRYAAAGGVVVDGDRVLALRRASRREVRLPKGHVEHGESTLEAAVREVGEEGGYVELELVADLGIQHVEFELESHRVERDEHYFLFTLAGQGQRSRNHHDRKFEPIWMPWRDALSSMTFEPEREWVRRAAEASGVNLG